MGTCVGTYTPLQSVVAKSSEFMRKIYRPRDYQPLNEMAGAIGQMLGRRCHGRLVSDLKKMAEDLDMADETEAFVMLYPRQKWDSPAEKKATEKNKK